MQKKYADFKLGVPDYVTVETEEERLVCQGGQTTVAAGATTVEFQDAGGAAEEAAHRNGKSPHNYDKD